MHHNRFASRYITVKFLTTVKVKTIHTSREKRNVHIGIRTGIRMALDFSTITVEAWKLWNSPFKILTENDLQIEFFTKPDYQSRLKVEQRYFQSFRILRNLPSLHDSLGSFLRVFSPLTQGRHSVGANPGEKQGDLSDDGAGNSHRTTAQ